MSRVILLALSLSAVLWTAAARTELASPDDIIKMSGVASCSLAGDSNGSSDSDQQWRAGQQTIAAVTESVWKSSPVHAALAATRSALLFDAARAVSSPDPPIRSAPHYLRHTPLLI